MEQWVDEAVALILVDPCIAVSSHPKVLYVVRGSPEALLIEGRPDPLLGTH